MGTVCESVRRLVQKISSFIPDLPRDATQRQRNYLRILIFHRGIQQSREQISCCWCSRFEPHFKNRFHQRTLAELVWHPVIHKFSAYAPIIPHYDNTCPFSTNRPRHFRQLCEACQET